MSTASRPHPLPGILLFLPMLYVGWADDHLEPAELSRIRSRMQTMDLLTSDEKKKLLGWLDPANPPSADVIRGWLREIRAAAALLTAVSRHSLASLGLEIANAGAEGSGRVFSSDQTRDALMEIESALGIVSDEAARELMGGDQRPLADPPEQTAPRCNPGELGIWLNGPFEETITAVKSLLTQPAFEAREFGNTHEYREQVLLWTRQLAAEGYGALAFPKQFGGGGDLGKFAAAFEALGYGDLSLLIKFGVQFGLFGGAVHQLGTEWHHQRFLRPAGTLELPGCFAMTELGHGSNVRDIETTATYDPLSAGFVIHTPHHSAHKEYIGNAALHGQMAVVFAQLIVGEECRGVHALLVPIRNDSCEVLPGIRIEDTGLKLGLNGVDNGRIWFERVWVPRQHLLNRFADVTPQGEYVSPIASDSKRFFTMLGTLIGGRVSIAASASSAAKTGLTIAVRYAAQRRQFGPGGQPETRLLDYRSHQRRLMPLLAKTYAINCAVRYLQERFVQRSDAGGREVESLAAGIKVYSSWHTTRTLQECREACGGKGYIAASRFAALKADTDIFTTFEGDNTVLMQLVARGRLSEFKESFHDINFFGLVKYIAGQAATVLAKKNPIVTRMTDSSHLRDRHFHIDAFTWREHHLLETAAKRIKKRMDMGMDSYTAFIEVQPHLLNLGQAYVERVVLEQFLAAIDRSTDAEIAGILTTLAQLYALHTIESHRGWYLEDDYMESSKTKAIRKEVTRLCAEVAEEAIHLVDAFLIPDGLVGNRESA